MTPDLSKLPYRPCVGIVLLNSENLVWIGKRIQQKNDDEAKGVGMWWQMPQGGIDEGEDIQAAAFRELTEETGVTSAELIGEISEWYFYDLPDHLIGVSWKGRYRGQKQKWVVFRFTGDDREVDISGIGHKAEFEDWQWAPITEVVERIVPFKRPVYEKLAKEMANFAP